MTGQPSAETVGHGREQHRPERDLRPAAIPALTGLRALIVGRGRISPARSGSLIFIFPNGPACCSTSAVSRLLGGLQPAPGSLHLGLGGGAVGPGRVPDALAWLQRLVHGEEVVDLQPVELGYVL